MRRVNADKVIVWCNNSQASQAHDYYHPSEAHQITRWTLTCNGSQWIGGGAQYNCSTATGAPVA